MPRYYGINRYICDVLEDMRKCKKTLNFGPLDSLIEECQILATRMESALGDVSDIRELSKERKELKDEVKKLREEVKKLEEKTGKKKSKKKNKSVLEHSD